jgi:outer membrane receptor for ferrienterochelin and colicins
MSKSILLVTTAFSAWAAAIAPALAQAVSTEIPETITVTAQRLTDARVGIQTQLGATTYTVNEVQIESQPGGENDLLNQVILQFPDVAQDSFGQFHIRGEHNALQYRINGIVLPEGISVFGQTLDPRLASSVELIDGALPAEYGLETGGIVDIETKSGLFNNGGQVSMYGGSHNTLEPSFEYGGSSGSFNYFVAGDYDTNSLGIEAPTNAHTPEHDRTTQYHGFAFLQDILDQNSSVTAVLGTSDDNFQIPNIPGEQPSGVAGFVGLGPVSPTSGFNVLALPNGNTQFLSDNLDERQRERTDFGTISYLRSQGPLDVQLSIFGRFSSLYYTPGSSTNGQNLGDLLYNGISQIAYKRDIAYGTQDEGAYHLGTSNTIRFGVFYQADDLISDTTSLVLPTAAPSASTAALNPNPLCAAVDSAYADANFGSDSYLCQVPGAIQTITDNTTKHAWVISLYLQDEWKLLDTLTINYGVRWDEYRAFSSGAQISPRANAVWDPFDGTVLHIGYARYFSPPPIELVSSTDVSLFNNTTNQPLITQDTTPAAERADYYDAGATQELFPGMKVGLDSFYKLSKDMIDEGQFGAPIILTPFNYAHGRQYGAELTANYTITNFTAYANVSLIHAVGKDWVTSQFNFVPDEFTYTSTHWIDLDHESLLTASGGLAYRFMNTIISSDLIYGYGLRESLVLPDGSTIPNGAHTPGYVSTNVGISHDFSDLGLAGLSVRFDVINVFDTVYEIRNGTGVGVFAPQYGARRGFFGGITQKF